jgi:hypothetical protein
LSNFAVRPFRDEDIPFVFSSWLKSYRDSPAVRSVPNTNYYAGQHSLIEGLLQQPNAVILVACDPNDPSAIFGYMVAQTDPAVFHFFYTKHAFRGWGIAKTLASALPQVTAFTHRVKNIDELVGSRTLVFDPYILFNFKKAKAA